MKVPKLMNRHCPYCNKHTEHKVSLAKRRARNASRPMSFGSTHRVKARGERRGAGNLGKYSKPTKPKMIGKKQSKKTDFRYECTVCKKQHAQSSGIRAKKVEFV
ncbi:MAG: 50S ribosomal protein L44e [Candidatus Nanoarchaeia archaeon]|jgi:large subunit ribosomal protein L44e|nr:50S ribosomal protein L44e [Candidatus Nanoarchaeia archaeon]